MHESASFDGQGILSPPSSGRTYKQDEPRIPTKDTCLQHASFQVQPFAVEKLCLAPEISSHLGQNLGVVASSGSNVVTTSPRGKADSDGSVSGRMLTPPLSRDTRLEGENTKGSSAPLLTDSQQAIQTIQSRPIDVGTRPPQLHDLFDIHLVQQQQQQHPHPHHHNHQQKQDLYPNQLQQSRHVRKRPVASADSDVEDNPFLNSSNLAPSSQPSSSRAQYTEPDEVSNEDMLDEEDAEQTPKRRPIPFDQRRPNAARPLNDRVCVENHDLSSTLPIRDTPLNPFLEGGPADDGFFGPRSQNARQRAVQYPGKERGKITYVFRGQRVTYADPEYDSDDSEEYLTTGQRPQRLQPKLLFPSAITRRSNDTSECGSPRSHNLTSGGGGDGLFASELAARRKRDETLPPPSNSQLPTSTSTSQPGLDYDSRQVDAFNDHPPARRIATQAERSALLAKLDQADWSDDEDDQEVVKEAGRDDQPYPSSLIGKHGRDQEETRSAKRMRTTTGYSSSSECSEDAEGEDDVAFWLQDSEHHQTASSKLAVVSQTAAAVAVEEGQGANYKHTPGSAA